MTFHFHRTATAILLSTLPVAALASTGREMPNFTGPLVTPAVNTLPAGAVFVEPYLIHTNARGAYGNDGDRRAHRHTQRQWQVFLPVMYGLTDTTTIQVALNASRTSGAYGHTDGLRMGDSTVRVQQRLTGPGDDGTGWVTAFTFAQRLPTGSYHHLDTNPLNGTGNGSMRSIFAFGVQKLQWLPDGQAIRWRGQLSWSPTPGHIRVRGSSVYGTGAGFRGTALPGQAWNASFAAEYALDQHWVLVNEAIWNRNGIVRMKSTAPGVNHRWKHRPQQDLSLAPAVEYHFNPTLGLIGGVQFTVAGRNTASYVAPQLALTKVF